MLRDKPEIPQSIAISKTFLTKKLIISQIISVFLFFTITLYADSQFDIGLDNDLLVNDNTYEFDVVIKSNQETFTLTSYQAAFVLSQEVINNGEVSFLYVEGTSELSNVPAVSIGLNLTDGIPKFTFASLPGEDLINTSYIRIGRFRIQNTNSFSKAPDVKFNFDGKVTTILTGRNFVDITNLSNLLGTGVTEEQEGNNLDAFELKQNYPNPFNPNTNIEFELRGNSKVKLAVYNILGEEVAELFNGKINAGTHKYQFNASGLASGIYVYRLDVRNEFTETKKMVLMR